VCSGKGLGFYSNRIIIMCCIFFNHAFVLPNPADLLTLLIVSENSDYNNMNHCS